MTVKKEAEVTGWHMFGKGIFFAILVVVLVFAFLEIINQSVEHVIREKTNINSKLQQYQYAIIDLRAEIISLNDRLYDAEKKLKISPVHVKFKQEPAWKNTYFTGQADFTGHSTHYFSSTED